MKCEECFTETKKTMGYPVDAVVDDQKMLCRPCHARNELRDHLNKKREDIFKDPNIKGEKPKPLSKKTLNKIIDHIDKKELDKAARLALEDL